MSATVITITNATLRLADDAAGIATADATYECQVITASVNAVPNLQPVPATFCQGASQTAGATGYELSLSWLQDWTAPGGGLSGYAFDNDAELKYFTLTLEADEAGPPLCSGTLRVVSGAFGGDAGVALQATATWPIQGKPAITYPPAAP